MRPQVPRTSRRAAGHLEGRNGVEEPRKRLDAPPAEMVLGSAPIRPANLMVVALEARRLVEMRDRWINPIGAPHMPESGTLRCHPYFCNASM